MIRFIRDLVAIVKSHYAKHIECRGCGELFHPDFIGAKGECVNCFLTRIFK